jgi:hypothetical protein
MINLKNDYALKLYSDALYNLDFSTAAFPAAADALDAKLTPSVTPLNMALVDTSLPSFLSSSCLIFQSTGENSISDYPSVMSLGTTKSGLDVPVLSIANYGMMSMSTSKTSTSPTPFMSLQGQAAYPLYDFVSTVGDTVVNGLAEQYLRLGTSVEKVLCVPFDPYDFEVELESGISSSTASNIRNIMLDIAEQEVGTGLETSQGVELCTFRVSIVIPDEGKCE